MLTFVLNLQKRVHMDLIEYFNSKKGLGILATADSDGNVD
jgi:hypothetical protein